MGYGEKRIIVNIPKLFSIAVLKFQNTKKPRNKVQDDSNKYILLSYRDLYAPTRFAYQFGRK